MSLLRYPGLTEYQKKVVKEGLDEINKHKNDLPNLKLIKVLFLLTAFSLILFSTGTITTEKFHYLTMLLVYICFIIESLSFVIGSFVFFGICVSLAEIKGNAVDAAEKHCFMLELLAFENSDDRKEIIEELIIKAIDFTIVICLMIVGYYFFALLFGAMISIDCAYRQVILTANYKYFTSLKE